MRSAAVRESSMHALAAERRFVRVMTTMERPLSGDDSVAKVFLGCRTKILRAADAFYARRREGPYRFIQNRSRTSAVALKSDAAAEKSKDQLSREFPGRSIFDFCNKICQKRKSARLAMSSRAIV